MTVGTAGNGTVRLAYEIIGPDNGEPLMLMMGLDSSMRWWPDGFCLHLAERGFAVIRFDFRDVGRSSRAQGRVTRRMLVEAFAGRRTRAPYSMHDLADDSFGLLDHLGISSAHIVGISMGGMIAQTMAIEQPARVRSS